MPRFLVRLQLHDVPADAQQRFELYQRLHTTLAAEAYRKCVDDPRSGTRVQLPDATYVYDGTEPDKVAIGKLAVAAAWRALGRDKFARPPGVVVTGYDSDAFLDGLDPCPTEEK